MCMITDRNCNTKKFSSGTRGRGRPFAKGRGIAAVGKVNVDEQPELAEQFKVMTIPSLFVFQNGEHGEAIIAPGSKAQIEEFMRAQGAL